MEGRKEGRKVICNCSYHGKIIMATGNSRYIGLSLSFCVSDVLEGKISFDQIVRIVASTSCATTEEWDSAIAHYCKYYWSENPQEAKRIVYQLLSENKIEQPRLQNLPYNNLDGGHWQNEEGEKVHL
ncbi:MAG: hypothetical protein WCJ33_07900 [Pseudomonadota bacterium]